MNISSVVGRRALPARSLYSASKFAVAGFSEAIRAELAKDGIDVIVVNPGPDADELLEEHAGAEGEDVDWTTCAG